MKRLIYLVPALAVATLAGCSTQTTLQRVNVPIPVECRAQVPARPVMPTEVPAAVFTLDGHVARLQAEVEEREAYEIQLRAALDECLQPIAAAH